MTDDDRKAALEWWEHLLRLNGWTKCPQVAVLRAMLAAPRLPAEPTQEAIAAMHRAWAIGSAGMTVNMLMADAYRALHAHLSKPATRTVYVVRAITGPTETTSSQEFSAEDSAWKYAQSCVAVGVAVTITPEERPA